MRSNDPTRASRTNVDELHQCATVVIVVCMNAQPPFPTVDINDPKQNEFVQDWLSAWLKEYIPDPDDFGDQADDYYKVYSAIELIQETYSPDITTARWDNEA